MRARGRGWNRARTAAVAAIATSAALALTGCANEQFAQQQAQSANNQGYISGDGSYQEFAPAERKAPVAFSGKTTTGEELGAAQTRGSVTVVNFWYAACPPCRLEAKDLQALYAANSSRGVKFVGVNVYDQKATAESFATAHGIEFPTILDVESASVRVAFAETVPPQAIPSTLVLDRQGRVAAIIRGVADRSTLGAMIDRVVAESS